MWRMSGPASLSLFILPCFPDSIWESEYEIPTERESGKRDEIQMMSEDGNIQEADISCMLKN